VLQLKFIQVVLLLEEADVALRLQLAGNEALRLATKECQLVRSVQVKSFQGRHEIHQLVLELATELVDLQQEVQIVVRVGQASVEEALNFDPFRLFMAEEHLGCLWTHLGDLLVHGDHGCKVVEVLSIVDLVHP